ncbi:MAG: S8 family serine peptidase [Proteobacteria bacterium]|nr:S8 family serine peptidase [Pseudomonadota bacterium]
MTALTLLFYVASAGVPIGTYPDCSEENQDACPSDLDDWQHLSWIPEGSRHTVRPAELSLGSGMSLDVAVRQETGRWDAIIAVLDSGIYWQETKLYNKIYLNTGELPQPTTADGQLIVDWDLDQNGLVNLDDYRQDPRIDIAAGVGVADDRLDPSDLIHTFSDGVDDDGNGFVDDIAGWDFFNNDNDPFAALQALQASHGTGVAKEAALSGDDGSGIGTCPNCAVLPIRIGDSFIVTGDRVALGVAYAADAGVRVLAMASGALTHPEVAVEALEYANNAGVVLVAAAGDENSYHHNFPAADDAVLYVHSIRANNQHEDDEAYSYFNILNCNNWGPRLDLVAPATSCATGSVAAISGAAGLIVSAGLNTNQDLAAEEVKALLRGTADDVFLTEEERETAGAYPSKEGWDAFYGYGRVNLGRAVQAVYAGEIPPIARITAPRWFTFVDTKGPAIEVTGVVEAPRSAVESWSLQVGFGAEPSSWEEVASGSGPVTGLLASVDPSSWGKHSFDDLLYETVVERMERAHEPLVTLRLVVTDTEGLTSEDRNGIWAMNDPDLLPGFPFALGSSAESPLVLTDLDDDGVFEIVMATTEGRIHAFDGGGGELPGFPVHTDRLASVTENNHQAFSSGAVVEPYEGVMGGVSVGDIDGDGDPEIVVPSLVGKVYAWHADGEPVVGFPVAIMGREPDEYQRERAWENGVASTPALADIDGDGALEIVVSGMDQRMYVWDGMGSAYPGYPLELCFEEYCDEKGARILSSPAVGDIDGDGDLDCATGTNEVPEGAAGLVYIFDLDAGEVWPGFPLKRSGLINQTILPLIGEGHPSSVSLADLDHDGDLEFISNAMLGAEPPAHHDGSWAYEVNFTADSFGKLANFTDGAFMPMISNASFGDLNHDGVPEYVLGGAGVQWLVSLAMTVSWEYQHGIGAWDGVTGTMMTGFPRQVDDVAFLMAPVVGDISGDGYAEVLYGSGGHFLYGWDQMGEMPPHWPKFTGGWMIAGPALGDINGDGYLDVVIANREGTLFAWSTKGSAAQKVEWASARHDPQNTGNYETPLEAQLGPAALDESEGCCKEKNSPERALLMLPLFLLYRRRRAPRR